MGAGLSRFGLSVEKGPFVDPVHPIIAGFEKGFKDLPNVTYKDGKLFINPYNDDSVAKVIFLSFRHEVMNVAKCAREMHIFLKYKKVIEENPYFLNFVECFHVSGSGVTDDLEPSRKWLFDKHLKKYMTGTIDSAFVVVTKLVQTPRTLRKIFDETKGEYGSLHYVLCMQVLQALKKLREWKIVHNDFHMDNVMVVSNENETSYRFESYDGGKNITFESVHCIQVFDWDLAVTANSKKDLITERAISFSEGEEKRDLVAFFTFLVQRGLIDAEAELEAANSHGTGGDLDHFDCFSNRLKVPEIVDGDCNALFADATYEAIWGKLYDIFYEKLTEAKSNDGTL